MRKAILFLLLLLLPALSAGQAAKQTTLGLYKPAPASRDWGTQVNANFDKINALFLQRVDYSAFAVHINATTAHGAEGDIVGKTYLEQRLANFAPLTNPIFAGTVQAGALQVAGSVTGAAGSFTSLTVNGKSINGNGNGGSSPWLLATDYGATGSDNYTTATCTNNSFAVTLAQAKDFKNGDSIHLFHCGTPVTLASPANPARILFGSAGTKQFTYWISALTKNGGVGPAGAPFVVSDAPNATFTNGIGLKITWDAVPGADGYAVYHKTASGSEVLKDIIGIPGQAQTWVKNRPYHTGDGVRPVTDNGRWYKATGVKTRSLLENGGVAGCAAGVSCTVTPLSMTGIFNGARLRVGGFLYLTNEVITASNVTATTFDFTPSKRQPNAFTIEAISGTSEPVWCTSARCTVTDGGITWTEQPYYFYEDGGDAGPATMIGYNGPLSNRLEQSVPLTHPTSNLAETLVAKIVSGGGTAALTLDTSASANTSGWLVEHDDTAALLAAQSDFASKQISSKPAYEGSPYLVNSGCLYVPWGAGGRYKITSPLGIPACMQGGGNPIIEQVHPLQNVLFNGYAYTHYLADLSLFGGMNQFHYLNSNSGGRVDLINMQFAGCRGFAVYNSQRPGGDNDLHLSSDFHVLNPSYFGCRHHVYNQTDWYTSAHITYFAHSNGQDPETAYYVNDSGNMAFDDFFASPPVPAPGNRWIETRNGSLHINNMRFGGESAGMPPVYTRLPYDFARSGYGGLNLAMNWQGQNVTIENSAICSLNSVIVAYDSLPGFVNLHGNGCKNNAVMVDTSRLNLDEILYDTTSYIYDTTRLPGYEVVKWDINMNQLQGASASVADQLASSLSHRVSMAAQPTSGNWMQGQIVYKSGTINPGDPVGWITLRSGRAAATWFKNTSYAQGSWVVPSTDNGRVYYAVVGGTSDATTEPTWNKGSSTWASATTTDGTVTWADYGPAALFENWPPASSSSSSSGASFQLTDVERTQGIVNRLPWSDDFTHWTSGTGVSVTCGQTDPWGGINACRVTRPGNTQYEILSSGSINTTDFTANQVFGCWLKKDTLSAVSVGLWDATANSNVGLNTVNLTDTWTWYPMTMTINPAHSFSGINLYAGGFTKAAGSILISSCGLANENPTYHKATTGVGVVDSNSGFLLNKNARLDGGLTVGGNASIDATGKVTGQQLCIAADCKNAWPNPGTGTVGNNGTLTSGRVMIGDGTTVIKASALAVDVSNNLTGAANLTTWQGCVSQTGLTGPYSKTAAFSSIPAGKYAIRCAARITTTGSAGNIDTNVFFFTPSSGSEINYSAFCRIGGASSPTTYGSGSGVQSAIIPMVELTGGSNVNWSTTFGSGGAVVYNAMVCLEKLP